MLYWFTRPLRFLFVALGSQDTPKQLAAGFALGMMIGLVPKGNLIAWTLCTVLMALNVNLGSAVVGAFIFTWIGAAISGATVAIGQWLLDQPSLQDFWTRLYNMPIVPWTCFNYYVVLGGFVLGLIAFYPIYRLTIPFFAKYKQWTEAFVAKRPWLGWLMGEELRWTWRMG